MKRIGILVVLITGLICGGMSAAPVPPPALIGAPAENPHTGDPMLKVIDDIDLQNVSIIDFVEFVQQKVPEFQVVIVRDPNVENYVPNVPPMRLKKVTLGQLLTIMADSCPMAEISPVTSEAGKTVFVCKIHADRTGARPAGPAQSVLKVYSLFSMIGTIKAQNPIAHATPSKMEEGGDKAAASRDDSQKEALNALLSLVKATLAQADNSQVAPTVQVHEETLTLILKGTPEQINAVDQAFSALKPPSHDNDDQRLTILRAANLTVSEENERLKAELSKVSRDREQTRRELLDLQAQMDAAKINSAVKKANESKE